MKIRLLSVFLLIFYLLPASTLKGQRPVMRQFTAEDGLPGGIVYCTMQDSKGYIWSGTDRGLARFDGNEFKVFTVKDGLPSNDVWGISEDEKGSLWLDTFNGVCYVKDEEVHLIKNEQMEDLKGKITHYFSKIGHLIQIDRHNFFRLVEQQKLRKVSQPELNWVYLPSKDIIAEDYFEQDFISIARKKLSLNTNQKFLIIDQCVFIDQDDYLLEKIRNLVHLSPIKDKSSRNENLRTGVVLDLVVSFISSDKVLLFVDGQLYILNNKTLSIEKSSKVIERKEQKSKLISIKNIGSNTIWIKKLHENIFVDSLLQEKPEYSYLRNMSINDLFLDRQGNLWINTNNGLFFINQQTQYTQSFQNRDENRSISFNFLAKNNQPYYWALNADGFLYRLDPATGFSSIYDNPIIDAPTSLKFDFNNDLWVSGGELIRVPNKYLLQKTSLSYIYELNKKNKRYRKAIKNFSFLDENRYVATTFNCFIEYQYDNYDYITRIDGRHYGLAVIDNDHFVVTGNFGTHKVSRTGSQFIIDSIPDDEDHHVLHMPTNITAVGNDKIPWLAVNNIGLYRWNKTQLDSITELSDILVQSLRIDSLQRLWVCTNIGMAKIQNIKSKPFSYDFQWIRSGDGLISNSVNDVLIHENTIVVATDKGITILNDSILNKKNTDQNAPFLFSEILINGETQPLVDNYDLTYKENNLLIKYQCLDFKNLGNIIFQYKLVGVDNEWIDNRSFEKEYASLSPGNYTFLLRRKPSSPNQIPTKEISLHFKISPPYWKTGWFTGGVILLLGIIGFWLYKRQIKSIKQRAADANEINKKFAELELNALQSQMNPHFVFNSLNAIQDYIFKNEARTANRYLVKFSRLMRLFLESSKEKTILLEDEIQLLQLYIDLEQLRFEDKFTYEIIIAPHFSPAMVSIPSMLLQPFVENAINHGLIKLSKPGKLLLFFDKEDNNIHCRIEDDGIGIKQSLNDKTENIKGYKSRGMQLVKERQRVWKIIGDTSVKIDINDLFDEDKKTTGTRVDIYITIEN